MKIFSHILLCVILLGACSGQYGRYQQQNDSTPVRKPAGSELHDATPRAEPYSRGGNKNYTVRGKNYQVLNSAENFTQVGTASWYGKKFHGHLTSNGEIYNMYSMSAAHKNLPIPTYATVTNLANNKSVIVRVNDRGPFHQDRIIDLSYSAAYKLDMLKTGTAKVKITAITDFTSKNFPLTHAQPTKQKVIRTTKDDKDIKNVNGKNYIQVFATKNESLAKKTATALALLYQQPAKSKYAQGIFRVQIGPITEKNELEHILSLLKNNGYPQAFKRHSL